MNTQKPRFGTTDALDSLLLLHRRRQWALRVLVLVIAAAVLMAVPLLLVAPPLVGELLLLPTLWACFLFADAALLATWRSDLLQQWCAGPLNLGIFAEAIATVPMLAKASTRAILQKLPVLPPLRDRDLEADVRMAIAAFSDWRWVDETASALLPSILLAVASACAAMLLMTAIPLSVGVLAVVAALVIVVLRVGVPFEWKRRLVRTLAQMAPERRAAVLAVARELDWSGTSNARCRRMLRTLERTCTLPLSDNHPWPGRADTAP